MKLQNLLRVLLVISSFAPSAALAHLRIEVTGPATSVEQGRLIVFIRSANAATASPTSVDGNAFETAGLTIAAREVTLVPGITVGLDGDDLAFPASLDGLADGRYVVQAVLDRDHTYAYSGRGPGDMVSDVVEFEVTGAQTTLALRLERAIPVLQPWQATWGPVASEAEIPLLQARVRMFDKPSKVLSAFSGRPISMRGMVVTPLDYDKTEARLPIVYLTHGFGGGMVSLQDTAAGLVRQMKAGVLPSMIWVLLDQSSPFGTHEFADSLNNGPWGTALITELIPALEAEYRATGDSTARFVMGHSSGGWAALWLQLQYPKTFGGAWATSPDFTDFSDFGGVDITMAGASFDNLDFARAEAVLGDYGGQAASFEAVWSPRGSDGRPMPLYDRRTGIVDASVATWWRTHWDLTEKVRREWRGNRKLLDGRITVIVGDADEFKLDDSVRRFESAVKDVGGRATFRYLSGKGHFDLYGDGDERAALRRVIAWEMWDRTHSRSRLH